MGLFDRITNFVEDNATDVAIGFIGQLNTLDAEKRKADLENAKTLKTAKTNALKSDKEYFQSLTKTDSGRDIITKDWVNQNELRLRETGELENILQVLADIEAAKQNFGSEDTFLFSFSEGDKLGDTLNNINNKMIKDNKAITMLHDNNSSEYEKFINYVYGISNQYIKDETVKAASEYPDKNGAFNFIMNIGAEFGAIANNNLVVNSLKKKGLDFSNQAIDNMMASQVAENIQVPKDNIVILKGPEDDSGNFARVALTIPKKSMNQLKNYVAYTGRKDIQAVIDDYWYKNQAIYEGVDLSNVQETEAAIKKYYQPFIVAMEKLGHLGLEALDPTYKGPEEIVAEEAKALAFAKMLEGGLIYDGPDDDGSPDSQAMRAALLPFMNSDLEPEISPLGPVWLVKPKSERAYFLSRIGQTGEKFFENMAKGSEATEKSIQTLNQLMQATEDANAVGSAANVLKNVLGFFGRENVTTGSAGGFLSQLANSYDLEQGDRQVLAIANKRIQKVGGLDTELGRAEALRVVAAFEMARAFDPSGRLSNMDVEMQLARLGGGGLQTVESVKKQIVTAITDLRKKAKYYETFDLLKYSDTGVMSAAAQSRIDATIALMDIERSYMKQKYREGYIYVDGKLERREEGTFLTGTELGGGNNNQNQNQNQNQNEQSEAEPIMTLQGNPDIETDNLVITPNTPIPIDRNAGLSIDPTNDQQLIFSFKDNNNAQQVEAVTVTGPNGNQIPAVLGTHFNIDTTTNPPTITFLEF
tara:strand:- start:1106 stop:3379 length:2274 start_codon:yes stop_codon:yes gene_type:complete